MSWRITPTQPIPAVIGEPFGGGYFAGYISHTADGNPTHALIVAPRASGRGSGYLTSTSFAWKTTNTLTAGTDSAFDGAANTAAMVTAGIADHPAANFCVGLSIGGFSDWYLPARYELDIAYFNLKPSTQANDTSHGINIYSVPRRDLNNTATYPARTALTAFNTTAEAFVADAHLSSTEFNAAAAFVFNFSNSIQGSSLLLYGVSKTFDEFRVRAFRRIAL